MKIEEGKYYRTRDGRKVGPMGRTDGFWTACGGASGTPGHFTEDGISAFLGKLPREASRQRYDLIAEWTDEPASKPSPFVTRRELVPGVYGRVAIPENHSSKPGKIVIHLADSAGGYVQYDAGMLLAADELDEAAHLFAQLAEYLRETK